MTNTKIAKTNRIRVKSPTSSDIVTIYCSTKVVQEVRHLCERLNQILVPKRDRGPELCEALRKCAKTMPEHFPESSRSWLLSL